MNPPSRRVLGSKDTNSHLRTRSPDKPNMGTMSSPGKLQVAKKPSELKASASSPMAGTKRKIQEVDEAERIDPDLVEPDSQRTQLLSDTDTEEDHDTSNPQTSYDTAATSLPASQNNIEPQFELPQDEMSQRTYEKLHDVPMPQNTSQLPPARPGLPNDMSAGSVGLSHFFNFDGPPSTQNSDQLELVEIAAKTQAKLNEVQNKNKAHDTQINSVAARKRMLEEKTEQLRTRLQLAMFKVQTKQTNQPFSRLKHPKTIIMNRDQSSSPPTHPTTRLSTPTFSSSTAKQPSSARTILPQRYSGQQFPNSAEEHIAAMRARATNQNKPPIRNLNSLPMPRLDPQLVNPSQSANLSATDSFATQLIEDDSHSNSHSQSHSQHFPSSPPLSRESSGELPNMDHETQTTRKQQVLGTQLSSPPISEGRYGRSERSLAGLASVAVATQGEAVSGLVKLMTGE